MPGHPTSDGRGGGSVCRIRADETTRWGRSQMMSGEGQGGAYWATDQTIVTPTQYRSLLMHCIIVNDWHCNARHSVAGLGLP